ncbi:hypothetical protein B566_EDAN002083 [Ephemera danica]|nr:hypothetical protein B566_EDAN002083 [Ephemera danica]
MRSKIPTSNGDSGTVYYGLEIGGYTSDSASSTTSSEDLDSPTLDGDFTEYLWMENEEEFEKEVMQKLEEEELMEQCLEAMMEDEQEIRNLHNLHQHEQLQQPCSSSSGTQGELSRHLQALLVQDPQLARQSTLNPNAAEFVPRPPPLQQPN